MAGYVKVVSAADCPGQLELLAVHTSCDTEAYHVNT